MEGASAVAKILPLPYLPAAKLVRSVVKALGTLQATIPLRSHQGEGRETIRSLWHLRRFRLQQPRRAISLRVAERGSFEGGRARSGGPVVDGVR